MRKGLPQVIGRGFLISKGIELKFSQAGKAWARVPLVFKASHYDKDAEEWVDDNEILLQGTVFGRLAENLFEEIGEDHVDLDVVGEIYTDTWEKDGEEFSATKLNIAAASVVPKSSSRSGSKKPAARKPAKQQDPWADVPKDDPWGPPPGDDEPPF